MHGLLVWDSNQPTFRPYKDNAEHSVPERELEAA
jgi:hypothetical protein